MTHVTIERAKAQRIADAFEDLKKNHGIVYVEESVDPKQALAAPVQEPVQSRCANCGKVSSDASEILSDYPEDGEWFCSTECRDQHNELDCPHLTHNGYRHPVESAKLIECERIMRELASWLGCGGYNADEFIPSEFKAKIRHGIEHLYPLAAQPAPTVREPVAWVDSVMEQAQVFASAWSLVGGRFDSGNGLEDAEQAKAELRAMLATPPAQPAPETGSWYAAKEIDAMVRDLDAAMNGDGAAHQARLCDLMPQLIQRLTQPAALKGWRLVPEKPTREMVAAGSDDLRLGGSIGTIVRAEECYRAMLKAAPEKGCTA